MQSGKDKPLLREKRLKLDLTKLETQGLSFCVRCVPSEEDPYTCTATLRGPIGTPYEGGAFDISIKVPPKYPFEPPKVSFLTKIYHPNVFGDGRVTCCALPLLSENWGPSVKLIDVVATVYDLLSQPHPQCGEREIIDMVMVDPARYFRKARDWTLLYGGLDPAYIRN